VPRTVWTSIASSADGVKLAALAASGIYISTNSGTSWTSNNVSGATLNYVASSADGTKLVAVVNEGGIYTSADAGTTWKSNNAAAQFPYWRCVASSADGSLMAAGIGGNGGPIYTSTNFGAAWTSNSLPRQVWAALASSADGSRLIAAGYPAIYISTNSGTTWVSNNTPRLSWRAVASSADGCALVAGVYGGGIWISQSTPTPQLNIAPANPDFKLSWTVPSTNFVLQQSAYLISWADLTNPPALNLTNLQDEVVLSPTNSSGFYRLKTP